MIQINLLPKELQRKKLGLPEISFSPILAVIAGLIIVIHLFFILTVNLKTISLKRLEKKWQAILPNKGESDNLKQELIAMRTKIDAIDGLMANRLSWSKKLSDLSEAMMPGVWLNLLWLEKKTILQMPPGTAGSSQPGVEPQKISVKTLHMNGSVMATGGEETAAIGRFIKGLKANEGFFADFSEIESASIQRARLKDVEVMNFELICHFK